MGYRIRPRNIREELVTFNEELREAASRFTPLKRAIEGYINSTNRLQGRAYDASREYWSSQNMNALNQEVAILNNMIDVNNRHIAYIDSNVGQYELLDQDQLESSLASLDFNMGHTQSLIDQANSWGGYTPICGRSADSLGVVLNIQQGMYDHRDRQLADLLEYVSVTDNLYDEVHDQLREVERILLRLEQATFNPSTGRFDMPTYDEAQVKEILGIIPEDYAQWNLIREEFDLTSEQVLLAWDLGYTPQDLRELFNNFQSEVDVAFFRYLLSGTEEDFIEAFRIQPFELSVEMTILMADFSGRLFETRPEAFLYFNNAILASYTVCSRTGQWNRDIYLERMFIGASTIAESQAFLIGMNGGSEFERSQLDIQIALSGMWAMQVIAVNELSLVNSPVGPRRNPLNMSVRDIRRDGSDIFFNLDYICQITREEKVAGVENRFLESSSRLENEQIERELQRLRGAQRSFFLSLIEGAVTAGGAIILGVVAPKVALVTTIGSGLGGAITTWQSLSNDLSVAQQQELMRWFGSGGRGEFTWDFPFRNGGISSSAITFAGLYNPTTIELMLQWENEGLAGVLNMDDIEINAIRESVRANVEHSVAPRDHDRILTDIELILTGGFPILSEDFEAERFLSAINRIDRNNTGSNIFHRWERVLYYGGN